MAAPMPKEEQNKRLNNLLKQLKNKFHWYIQHSKTITDVELKQISGWVNQLNEIANQMGGNFHRDFTKFKKEFNTLEGNLANITPKVLKKCENMLNQLIKDLK